MFAVIATSTKTHSNPSRKTSTPMLNAATASLGCVNDRKELPPSTMPCRNVATAATRTVPMKSTGGKYLRLNLLTVIGLGSFDFVMQWYCLILHISRCRRRKALVITDTELSVIAALAMIGLRRNPKNG